MYHEARFINAGVHHMALRARKSVVITILLLRGYLLPSAAGFVCNFQICRSSHTCKKLRGWCISMHFAKPIILLLGFKLLDELKPTLQWLHAYLVISFREGDQAVCMPFLSETRIPPLTPFSTQLLFELVAQCCDQHRRCSVTAHVIVVKILLPLSSRGLGLVFSISKHYWSY